MAKEYLDKLNDLMKEIYPKKQKNVELIVKHFFGGAVVYANGKIFVTLTPVGFAIKLPKVLRNNLIKEKIAKTFKIFF